MIEGFYVQEGNMALQEFMELTTHEARKMAFRGLAILFVPATLRLRLSGLVTALYLNLIPVIIGSDK